MEETTKRGRSAAEVCQPDLLAHLRAWCDVSGAYGLTRYHTVPWGRYETLLDIPKGKIGRWYKQQAGGGGRGAQQLTQDEYWDLSILLIAWHGYDPLTEELKKLTTVL